MSWISENSLSHIQKFCINVLKCGSIPNHVAFIMDGNRRYAKKQHVAKAEGHSKGFDKLSDCLNWCLELGIKEVTVYAFSIENFKRTKDEVDQLMDLAREKFSRLFEEKDKLMENGICIRVIGNLTLLPDDLKKLIARAMIMTKDNKNAILNVAFSYTSRDEIANSMMTIVEGAKQGKIEVDDINESLISHCLYTNLSPNPDLLIRTSGEVRLSDFLLWQCANSQIFFAEVLWPEFNIWHLLQGVFYYQRGLRSMQMKEDPNVQEENFRIRKFVSDLNERRWRQLEIYAS
ncbi:dehydrodolichyl diphosphate synthase complex subunit DHDDS [Anthonomus grandis grandis]|uniref:dehydrodolichyl diphosphate synthase complex subunit DHDDS n=1 Tax=Anthonomus grandis grandis TaxID=2921223 RepID=UPI002165DDE2|nr:dehydrodolichyl diphosphate synthase complex subunit DHDDS [Anthonomus grandis grandis]